MSKSLSLLPFHPESMWSHEVLQCPEDHAVYKEIEKLPMLDVAVGFRCFYGEGNHEGPVYGVCVEDRYGRALMYTRAKHLKPVLTHKPAHAYINALDDDWHVALYWR